MKERGIERLFVNRQKSEDELFSPSCKTKEALVSFQLQDVIKPFSILIIGMLAALLILAIELIFNSSFSARRLFVKRTETISIQITSLSDSVVKF